MEFLNQLNDDIKDNTNLFPFNNSNNSPNNDPLPFQFESQGTIGGVNPLFASNTDMKSQNENSFNIENLDKGNKIQDNISDFNYLKTICEVPDSTNNMLYSQSDNGLLSGFMGKNKGALDFIMEEKDKENKDNKEANEEPINFNINNLFPPSKNSKSNSFPNMTNETFDINNLLNMTKNQKEPSEQNKITQKSFKDKINEAISDNNKINPNHNNNQVPLGKKSNSSNNKDSIPPNNLNVMRINITPSPNPVSSLKYSFKGDKDSSKMNNLDDIDELISMNSRSNKIETQNNKDNKNYFQNDISNIITINNSGKRNEIELKDKDIQNLDKLLNLNKENINSMNNNANKINDNFIKNNENDKKTDYASQMNGNSTPKLNSLPSDSFDKKSKVVPYDNNDRNNFSQTVFINEKKNKNFCNKVEMLKKYNDLVVRLNKIREKAKEYRNLYSYFNQLIIANENYNIEFPYVLKNLLTNYKDNTQKLISLMNIKNNKMVELNNEFDKEIKKYFLIFPEKS